MLKNYIKTSLRNLLKHKTYSLINISGFAVSMACCIIILLYVIYEFSYDRYNTNYNNIYRIVMNMKSRNGEDLDHLTTPASMAGAIKSEFPEIEEITRIFTYSWREKALVSNGSDFYFENRFFLADPSIFNIFSFQFIKGDPGYSLNDPNSVVITESMAKKYFGEEEPVGKILTVKNLGKADLKVTAVIKDVPQNSHFKFDFLASNSSGTAMFWPDFTEGWRGFSFYVYVLLKDQVNSENIADGFPAFIKKYMRNYSYLNSIKLQPLSDIHLYSNISGEIEPNNDIKNIYIFMSIGLIVLIIACVNFINLASARSALRSKEVGIRKVLGANKIQIIKQFLSESLLISLLSIPFALVLAELFLPVFSNMTGEEIGINMFELNGEILLILFGIILFTGIISGSYPAFIISGYQIDSVLKKSFKNNLSGLKSRNLLVTVQFVISTVFIIGIFFITQQMNYIRNTATGYTKNHIVVVPLKDNESIKSYEVIKREIAKSNGVISVTASGRLPSSIWSTFSVWREGFGEEEDISLFYNAVDYDFLKTYSIKLASGRDFSENYVSDRKLSYILNESAVKQFGWNDPVGKQFQFSNKGLKIAEFEKGTVIGVVKDFHFRSMHDKIEPLILKIQPDMFRYLSVKIALENSSETLKGIQTAWNKSNPGRPFDYFFFDENFNRLYKAEERINSIFIYSTLFSVFISCLGLFGLAAFTIEQRKKELCIRKVLGASTKNLMVMLSQEFTKWVLIANLIAWPVAFFIMKSWLENFAYRIELNIWTFIGAAFFAYGVAFITISLQTIKAAYSNPVDALRYE